MQNHLSFYDIFCPSKCLFGHPLILKELTGVIVSEVADNTSSSDRAYSTEEYLKITEEQLNAAAQLQNETSIPEQSPINAQSLSQG